MIFLSLIWITDRGTVKGFYAASETDRAFKLDFFCLGQGFHLWTENAIVRKIDLWM